MTRERLIDAFLSPPLYRPRYGAGATLYTAVYEPAAGRAEYVWPQRRIAERFDRFVCASHVQLYGEADTVEPAGVGRGHVLRRAT
jgi:hypothetical protein